MNPCTECPFRGGVIECHRVEGLEDYRDCEDFLDEVHRRQAKGDHTTYPRVTAKTPPTVVECPDCGGILERKMNTQGIWVYECPDPKCEMIDLKFNPRLGVYEIHREARVGLNGDAPVVDARCYDPKPCPVCGTITTAKQFGVKQKYSYQCGNPKCHVSRFRFTDDGKVLYTHKTPQFYEEMRNK